MRERDGKFETLMICDCAEGRLQSYALPRWEFTYGKLFIRDRCPLAWFMPEVKVVNVKQLTKTETCPQISYWRAKISIAEQYWKHAKENAT